MDGGATGEEKLPSLSLICEELWFSESSHKIARPTRYDNDSCEIFC